MNNEILISFIIPVYETKVNKLRRCLESVLQISNLKYEIVLVNDGSSKSRTKQYENICKNKKIKYIFIKNSGVSVARNKGIKKARGKYIFFLDSDDVVVPSAFDKKIENINSDIVFFDVEVKEKKHNRVHNLKNVLINKNNLLKLSLHNGIINWPVGKLFSRLFLLNNDLSFNTQKKTGEDLDFVVRSLKLCKDIKYMPVNSYIYYLSKSTSYMRYKKYPIQLIDDSWDTYNLRINISKNLLEKEKRKLENIKLTEDLIHSLFNIYILNLNDNNIKEKIITTLNKISKVNKFNSISRFRIAQIYKKNWIIYIYILLMKINIFFN